MNKSLQIFWSHLQGIVPTGLTNKSHLLTTNILTLRGNIIK